MLQSSEAFVYAADDAPGGEAIGPPVRLFGRFLSPTPRRGCRRRKGIIRSSQAFCKPYPLLWLICYLRHNLEGDGAAEMNDASHRLHQPAAEWPSSSRFLVTGFAVRLIPKHAGIRGVAPFGISCGAPRRLRPMKRRPVRKYEGGRDRNRETWRERAGMNTQISRGEPAGTTGRGAEKETRHD